MERLREEVNDEFKIGGPTISSPDEETITSEALLYLNDVKDMFKEQKEKYDSFLEIMRDYKAQRVETNGIIARIQELFKGYNHLILGFNTFLPIGYKINLQPKKQMEFRDAMKFLNKVKKQCGEDDQAYKGFLDIIAMFREKKKSIFDVIKEVNLLLKGHEDLLEEFAHFLPDLSRSRKNAVLPDQISQGPASGSKSNKRARTNAHPS